MGKAPDRGMFTLRRRWKAPAARVFAAWPGPDRKARRSTGPAGRVLVVRRMDWRPGGEEALEERFPSGRQSRPAARHRVVEPGRRPVCAYDMRVDGAQQSVTPGAPDPTVADDGATHVACTVQIVFPDREGGAAGREHRASLQDGAIERTLGRERLS